ncbi:MAG: hypothetical protein HY558_06555 [Euryarchaeota archaeon]|nr:hypothetical protein [Euryarchaeota archaeon]
MFRIVLGPLAALAAIGAVEALAWTPFRIPNAPAVILLAVVFSAFASGLWPGLFTAGAGWAYFAYFFSLHGQSGQLFTYSPDDYRRVLTWALATPAMALMVGVLKRRSEVLAREQAARSEAERSLETLERAHADLRSAQERLVASERMAAIGQMASRLAHEINNPLTVMMGYLERLKAGAHGDPRMAETVGKVEAATLRVRDLAQGLLDLARASRMEMSPVRVEGVLEDTRRMLAEDLEKHRVRLEWGVPPALPTVQGSGEHLQRVFSNLFLNARQAMPQGGTLTVSAAPRNGEVRVSVADTGVGILPENRPRLFEPFFTTKRGTGTGLGLAICQQVVSQHGGRIEVESEPGRGATFTIVLPASPPGPGGPP